VTNSDSRSTVLVVDDTSDNRTLLKAILQSAGFAVLTADSAAEARKLLTIKDPLHSPAADLVLSDISMPGESGFDLLEWMRAPENNLTQIPVLLITAALPEDENRIKGLALGAVDYIVRPINNQELVLRVRHALEHYKQFRQLRSTLESSEDMAMTGRILAAANHEIRNIVTLINITSEQAIKSAEKGLDMKPGSDGFQSLSDLSQMTKLLTSISRDLNSHIHAEEIRTTSCAVSSMLDDILAISAYKLKSINLERPAQGHFFVMADATRVKQIILNFLLNAADAIREKGLGTAGRITLKVTESSHGKLQIRVIDNGIGLLKPQSKSSFEAFQTTKAIRGGKGLGLWLCARLAQAMGGRVLLESEGPGLGATAILELRQCDAPLANDININDYLID
jgi:C4-dicarboxylate-specific signal transduction histidine kinase